MAEPLLSQEPVLRGAYRGHKDKITSLVFSPNGNQLISSSSDKTIIVWEFQPKSRAFRFVGHSAPVRNVSYHPGGQLIASVADDRSIRLWTPNIKGDSVFKVGAHGARIRSVSFSPDGSRILTAGDDKILKLWDVPSLRFVGSFVGHKNWVRCGVFSPDGRIVVSGGDDSIVRVWEVSSRKEIGHFQLCPSNLRDSGAPILALDMAPNGTLIAEGQGNEVRVWDLRMLQDENAESMDESRTGLVQLYDCHTGPITALRFHPSGNALISGSEDGTIRLFDLVQGRCVFKIEAHGGPVSAVAWNTAGNQFASAGEDGQLFVWDAFSAEAREAAAKEGSSRRVGAEKRVRKPVTDLGLPNVELSRAQAPITSVRVKNESYAPKGKPEEGNPPSLMPMESNEERFQEPAQAIQQEAAPEPRNFFEQAREEEVLAADMAANPPSNAGYIVTPMHTTTQSSLADDIIAGLAAATSQLETISAAVIAMGERMELLESRVDEISRNQIHHAEEELKLLPTGIKEHIME